MWPARSSLPSPSPPLWRGWRAGSWDSSKVSSRRPASRCSSPSRCWPSPTSAASPRCRGPSWPVCCSPRVGWASPRWTAGCRSVPTSRSSPALASSSARLPIPTDSPRPSGAFADDAPRCARVRSPGPLPRRLWPRKESAVSLLSVADLRVSFGGVAAVDGVSFEVEAGTLLGLIGPNGAGKTTTVEAVTGFAPLASGTISFDGHAIERWPPHRRARAGLVRTFQSVELFDDLSVRENLLAAAHRRTWRQSLLDTLWPRRHGDPDSVDEALEATGI